MARRKLTRPAKLVGNTLGNERSVELGLLDLLDIELNLVVAGHAGKFGTKAVSLGATTTDDDAGTSSVHVDTKTVASALDFDAADCRTLELRSSGSRGLSSPR